VGSLMAMRLLSRVWVSPCVERPRHAIAFPQECKRTCCPREARMPGLGTPDIFFSTVTGLQEAASVVALLQTAL